MSKSQMKNMFITFFDIKGNVHFELIEQGQTINRAYYKEIIKRSREAVPIKRPELRPNDLILHHNNYLSHKALSSSFWPKVDYWNASPILLS